MKLLGVRIDRLHALPPLEAAGLDPGLNLITGPNASGKSSLMELVQGCLWPRPGAPPPEARARLEWRAPVGALICEVDGGLRWSREGEAVPAPAVPPAALADCWALGLSSLLDPAPAPGERARHDQLRRLMAGGFDVARARDVRPLQGRPGLTEARRLREARAALRASAGERAALARDEDGLAGLRLRVVEAERAAAEARAAGTALAHRRALDQARDLEARLAGFPAHLDAVAPDDLERLDRLLAEAAAREADARGRAAEQARLDGERAALGLPKGPVPEVDLRAEQRRLAALERAQARAEAAERRLAALPSPTGASAALDPARLQAADAWLFRRHEVQARVDTLRAEVEAIEAEVEALGDEPASAPLEMAVGALDRWLTVGRAARLLGPVALLCLAGAAVLGWGGLPGPAWHGGAGALGGAGVGLAWAWGLGAWGRRRARLGFPPGLAPPARWAPAPVRARRRDLLDAQAAAAVWHARRASLEARAGQSARALGNAQAALAGIEAGAPLSQEAPWPPGPAAAWQLVETLRRELTAASVRTEVAAEVRVAVAERDALATDLARRLTAWGVDAARVRELPGLQASLEDLERRCLRWRELAAAGEAAVRAGRAADEAARILRAEAGELLARAGCDGREALAARVDALPAWRTMRTEVETVRREIARLAAELADRSDLLTLDGPALAARAGAVAVHDRARDDALQAIGRVEGALDRARASQDWEAALAREAAAALALDQARDDHLAAAATAFLLDDVEREHGASGLPPVAARASALFARFTRHRYTLEVPRDADAGTFLARDAHTGEALGLATLSDGSRMQLRLAARVAFAESLEAGVPLPLFLDESLTATDPDRFQAVAQALLSLDDRQLFYLTSSQADVAAWEAAARRAGRPLHRVALAPQGASAEALAPAPEVPPPGDLAPEAWAARLGVPLPDPWGGVGALAVFHLLRDDLPLVHHLLSTGVAQAGSLLNLLEALDRGGGGDPPLTTATRRRLRHRVQAAEALLAGWRVGRPRPVPPGVVLASGVLTRRYHEAARQALARLGGEGQALVEAIRERREALGFKGLHDAERRADDLADVLREGGFLDPRPPLDDGVLVGRALAASRVDPEAPTDPGLGPVLVTLLELLRRGQARQAA